MPGSGLLGGRYRIEEEIGHGGMGVVYRAVDTAFRRSVAVKTIRGPVDEDSIEQFRRESEALAGLAVPNIVDVYDLGEFVDKDGKKPFFVMPLLHGANLGEVLAGSEGRLEPERLVGIISQACKGLQAAHNRNVIHRDLKPSNLFVLDDDSVKIIDFGIVHLTGKETGPALKGTLHYMAPEQLEGKPTLQSDIFSLGVVCYQALTGRKPFDGGSVTEVMNAIRTDTPPPIPDLNPGVPYLLAKVVHRALAKQPYYRFSTAREFADLLQRALRNEPIPELNAARIGPRLGEIRKALGEGDCQYARELLRELDAEGHIEPEVAPLRAKIEGAIRSKTVHQLLESARARMEEEDYPLALEKVRNTLAVDAGNIDALALEREIQLRISSAGTEKWYQIARQHLDNKHFAKAREAVEEIIKLDSTQSRAKELKEQIRRGEQEQTKIRQEIHKVYESALRAYGNGEISTALTKLERVIELGKRVSGNPGADAQYVSMYDQIRQERDELQASYAEGRKALESKNFSKAREICKQVLDRRPQDALFKALSIQVDHRERQARSEAIAELHTRIEAETDVEQKYQLVKEAVRRFPDEPAFTERLKSVKEERDLVNGLVARARQYESQSQFAEARNQWDILRTISPEYPALEYELDRLSRKQQESLSGQARDEWVQKIEHSVAVADYDNAAEFLKTALGEFPGDAELMRASRELEQAIEKRDGVQELLSRAGARLADGDRSGALECLREARDVDPDSVPVREALIAALVEHASALVERDWRAALPFRDEALELDPNNLAAVDVSKRIQEASRREWSVLLPRPKVGAATAASGAGVLQPFGAVEPLPPSSEREPAMPEAGLQSPAAENREHVFAASPAATGTLSREEDSPDSARSLDDAACRDGVCGGGSSSGILAVAEPDPDESVLRRRRATANLSQPRPGSFARYATVAVVALLLAAVWLYENKPRATGKRQTAVPSRVQAQAAPPLTPPKSQSQTPVAQAPVNPSARADNLKPAPVASAPQKPREVPGFIAVHFQSDPEAAEIGVDQDENLTCLTPCELRLSPGEHSVLFSGENRGTVEKTIEIPGDDQNVFASLPDLLNVVWVISRSHLNVAVDGVDKGPAPVTLHLRPGNYQLTITGNGVHRQETLHVVKREDSGPLVINLDGKTQAAPPGEPSPAASQAPPGEPK